MIITKAKIIDNKLLADNIWQMSFHAPDIVKQYKGAGQFISISAVGEKNHILRRPMSIAAVNDKNITIIYKIFGSVTNHLSLLKKNTEVDVMGPLGNTFDFNFDNHTPILIGGGIGLSPILNLSSKCFSLVKNYYTIIGAKTSNEHFLEHDPEQNQLLCTNDGSTGIKGTVIDALSTIIDSVHNPFVYACGPEAMLSALKMFLSKLNIPGQFSVESYMACGFGFCQGCAIPKDDTSNYHLVCKDGPVFDYNEVCFD